MRRGRRKKRHTLTIQPGQSVTITPRTRIKIVSNTSLGIERQLPRTRIQRFRARAKQRARTIAKYAAAGAIIGAGTMALGKRVTNAALGPIERPTTAVKVPARKPGGPDKLPKAALKKASNPAAKEPLKPKAEKPMPEKSVILMKPFPKASAKMSVRLAKNAKCLSAKAIDAELKVRGSPAAGLGQEFVKWGKHYKVRPSVAMAFYRIESHWGTKGVARTTNAVGNIRYTKPKEGCPVKYTNYRGFRKYASREDGIRDFYRVLGSKFYAGGKRKTLGEIIPVYSPAGENNPKRYNQVVVNYLNELFKNSQ